MDTRVEKVEAFKCPFCGALYLENGLAESCEKQCEQILHGARFEVGDEIALARASDDRVFTVTGLRARRGAPGTVYISVECVNADGKAFVYPSAIIMSKLAKLKHLSPEEGG